ncbi:uncharacterized protein [Lolium perenne]|uniref:uncharacterized protein isoform X4 n=1 Tax=Lolium perenne TaxID=4522 RepID=UPI003A9A198C
MVVQRSPAPRRRGVTVGPAKLEGLPAAWSSPAVAAVKVKANRFRVDVVDPGATPRAGAPSHSGRPDRGVFFSILYFLAHLSPARSPFFLYIN